MLTIRGYREHSPETPHVSTESPRRTGYAFAVVPLAAPLAALLHTTITVSPDNIALRNTVDSVPLHHVASFTTTSSGPKQTKDFAAKPPVEPRKSCPLPIRATKKLIQRTPPHPYLSGMRPTTSRSMSVASIASLDSHASCTTASSPTSVDSSPLSTPPSLPVGLPSIASYDAQKIDNFLPDSTSDGENDASAQIHRYLREQSKIKQPYPPSPFDVQELNTSSR